MIVPAGSATQAFASTSALVEWILLLGRQGGASLPDLGPFRLHGQ